MHPIVHEHTTDQTPLSLAGQFATEPGLVLLHSNFPESRHSRYSLVAARPFLVFSSRGAACQLRFPPGRRREHLYGNPWQILESLMARFETLDQIDLPFPLGGCLGFWSYDLKGFSEPALAAHTANDLDLPDCHLGFYRSLVVFDHTKAKTWILSTGLQAEADSSPQLAAKDLDFWRRRLDADPLASSPLPPSSPTASTVHWQSSCTPAGFRRRVEQARKLIRQGQIYQVNLSHRLNAPLPGPAWYLYQQLDAVSPAPYSGFYHAGNFQIASSSPEQFLQINGRQIQSRPIKGTRPRSPHPDHDARLAYELQSSPKENAELIMITDLLRNDLGRICEFGSVEVPDLLSLEKFPHVHHLVSTILGQLRPELSHTAALASCFPGGSITGAPKISAMQIIDALEPVNRGPYTGCLGYLGFNGESQLSILIRAAVCTRRHAYFHAGAGIVADSDPHAEYLETLAKARGFLSAVHSYPHPHPRSHLFPTNFIRKSS